MLNQFSATPNPIFTVSIVFRVSTELEPRPIYLAIEPMPAQKHHSSYMSQQHSLLGFYWSEQSWWTSDKCCFAKLKTINKRREMHQMLASASKIQLKCWVRFFLVRGTFVGKYKKAFFPSMGFLRILRWNVSNVILLQAIFTSMEHLMKPF